MTPVVPDFSEIVSEQSVVTLAEYAQIIRYQETAFFGIKRDADVDRACRNIWTKQNRDMVARCLAQAQGMIEDVLNHPIGYKWFFEEQHPYTMPVHLLHPHIVACGIETEIDIEDGATLNHATDPATFTATIATLATDIDEIHLYHPGSDKEIIPSSLQIVAGIVSGTIPRARTVLEADTDNPADGWDYTDASHFETTIDIKWKYNDTTTEAKVVWPHGKTGCLDCAEETEDTCVYINSYTGSVVTVDLPDDTCISGGCTPSIVRVNYMAGIEATQEAKDAIIHLAHALMPIEPCGCDPIRFLWANDRAIPTSMTRDRLDCLFGVNEGCWRAWTYVVNHKHIRGMMI